MVNRQNFGLWIQGNDTFRHTGQYRLLFVMLALDFPYLLMEFSRHGIQGIGQSTESAAVRNPYTVVQVASGESLRRVLKIQKGPVDLIGYIPTQSNENHYEQEPADDKRCAGRLEGGIH